jgi:hypothetical protein
MDENKFQIFFYTYKEGMSKIIYKPKKYLYFQNINQNSNPKKKFEKKEKEKALIYIYR